VEAVDQATAQAAGAEQAAERAAHAAEQAAAPSSGTRGRTPRKRGESGRTPPADSGQ
jgi:hypothetical protein